MTDLLPSMPLLIAFLFASLALAVTPGPAVIYVLTRTLAQGRRAGLASVAGVALGNLGNAVGAAIGLAALFAVSSLAFSIVKYAGAAYLVWLGVKALRAASPDGGQGGQDPRPAFGPAQAGRIFRDGFLVALLNPKTALFFAAFLPQFMNPAAPAIAQSVLLGALFVMIAAATDLMYVFAASVLAPALGRMKGAGAAGRYVTASAFIGLGVFTAMSGGRGTK